MLESRLGISSEDDGRRQPPFATRAPSQTSFGSESIGSRRLISHRSGEPSVSSVDSSFSLEQSLQEERIFGASEFGRPLVVRKSHPFRLLWACIVSLLLLYTGTIFLYRLCFVDFAIQASDLDFSGDEAIQPDPQSTEGQGSFWNTVDGTVDILFYIDLVVYFFFSIDDSEGREVFDMRRIAGKYFRSYFFVNLFACIPMDLLTAILHGAESSGEYNRSLRALRLQRFSRLTKFFRLTRLARFNQLRSLKWTSWLEKHRVAHLINLVCGLLWSVHVMACGWYLCAYFHQDISQTWIARRLVNGGFGDRSLLFLAPEAQWLHAMYFVLTVFTTVGFGDIIAVTHGETVYAIITMGVGTIVHSIIVSEVIGIVTRRDKTKDFITKQTDLVAAFAKHTELEADACFSLQSWVNADAKHWMSHKYDREEMRDLLAESTMPREVLMKLPRAFFSGRLSTNRFLGVLTSVSNTPPRLTMLLALAVQKNTYSSGEIVFQAQDYPFSMFLVLSGTFAYVAKPTRWGGVAQIQGAENLLFGLAKKAKSNQKKAGSLDKLGIGDFVKSGMLSTTRSKDNLDAIEAMLFPYMLFSTGSYFGECELLRTLPRKSTARCETESGELLALNKPDFMHLMAQFPQFGKKWATDAARRENLRLAKQTSLTQARTFRHYGVATIQHWWRELMRSSHDERPVHVARHNEMQDATSIHSSHSASSTSDMLASASMGKCDRQARRPCGCSLERDSVKQELAELKQAMLALTEQVQKATGIAPTMPTLPAAAVRREVSPCGSGQDLHLASPSPRSGEASTPYIARPSPPLSACVQPPPILGQALVSPPRLPCQITSPPLTPRDDWDLSSKAIADGASDLRRAAVSGDSTAAAEALAKLDAGDGFVNGRYLLSAEDERWALESG